MAKPTPFALQRPASEASENAGTAGATLTDAAPEGLPAVPLSEMRLLPRKIAAATLGISVRLLDSLATDGKVRSVKIGDRRLFRPADLDAFVAELSA